MVVYTDFDELNHDDPLLTLSEESQEYVIDYLSEQLNYNAKSTVRGKKSGIRQFCAWLDEHGKHQLDSVSAREFKRYITEILNRDLAPDTMWSRYMYIKGLYDWLASEEIIDSNTDITRFVTKQQRSAMKDRTKKEEAVPEGFYLTAEEVDELLQEVNAPIVRNRLIIKLLFNCGLRRAELAQIKLDRIDWGGKKIAIDNLKSARSQPLTRNVYYKRDIETLLTAWVKGGDRDAEYYSDSEYLFPTQKSEYISVEQVNQVVKDGAENAGYQELMYEDSAGAGRCKITAHTLRHSFAVHCIRSDTGEGSMDIKTLADLMGHVRISTTEQYLRYRENTRKDAALQFGPGSNAA